MREVMIQKFHLTERLGRLLFEENNERIIGLSSTHMVAVEGIRNATLYRYGKPGGYYDSRTDKIGPRYPVAQFRSPGLGVIPMWQVGFAVTELLMLDASQFMAGEHLAIIATEIEEPDEQEIAAVKQWLEAPEPEEEEEP